jgi:hypothetical protein
MLSSTTSLDAKRISTTTNIRSVSLSHQSRIFLWDYQIWFDHLFNIFFIDSILLFFGKFDFKVPFSSIKVDYSALLIQKYNLSSKIVCFKSTETFDIDSLLEL